MKPRLRCNNLGACAGQPQRTRPRPNLETCATKTKQPPRGSARRLNLYSGGADFSDSAPANSLSIFYHLGRRPDHLKLGAHFLDLGALLSELDCESRYLFLLLRDRCLQLVNFVIQHGLVLGVGARGRLRCATFHRCATRRYARCALVRANVPAKFVVIKVYSNFNNAAANRLVVKEDTTDEAG